MHAFRPSHALLLCAILFPAAPALAGGAIVSGVTTSGSLANPTYTESWTFSGNNGERVVLVAVTTGGVANTVVTLRAPGGAVLLSTAADHSEFQLTSTGVHTIEVSDLGLNDAGTYAITYLNLTSGPLTHAGDLDGDAIVSGEVRGGTIGVVADIDAFTFSGTAGQRILFGALEGTAPPFNVTLTLYPPGGGAQEASTSGGNRIDVQLSASGTYTVVVEDIADDDAGSYTVSHLNVSGGPHSTIADPDGGTLVSATRATGTMNGVVDWDAFTFNGSIGDRIAVVALTTSGTMNTTAYLYPPNGGPAQISTAADRWDFQLSQSGTHTLVIEDQNFGDTGTYTLALLNITSGPLTEPADLDGGPIASGEVGSATIGAVTDLDAFTFSGTAGQRILFGALEGTGSPFNATMTLYPPGGGALEASTSGGNRIDVQLAATGTYTVVVEDVGDNDTGSYTVSHLNVSGGPHSTIGDPDGGAIVSATRTTGTMNGVLDWDGFTFSGSTGDRIVVVALTTSGTMNTTAYLYPPNGGPAQISTAADRWDFQLTQSGTHTLVIEDQNFGDTGTYTLALLNVTSGPLTEAGDLDGGAIASGEVRGATIGVLADLDAFTFSGTAGQRILFGAFEGTALPFNTTMTLYPPGGGGLESSTSGGNKIDVQLAATGTYTVVVEDVGDNDNGSYTVSHLNVSGGPHSTIADPDGGALASAMVATGTMNGVLDWDAYTFNGTTGDRILAVALTTGGTLNTTAYLYPPNGGPAQVATSGDRWDFQLTQSGTHTLVIEDQNFGDTGTYALSFLNVTAGPLTWAGDLDGGALASNEVRAGTIGTVPDLDAFTFPATAGDRVVIGAIATGGASFNTTLVLYPPAGAPQVVSSSGGDRIDLQLVATGTYTAVVEDVADDTPGSYSISLMNLTAGPWIGAGDIDGGGMSAGQVRTGSVSPAPDFDLFWFNAAPGDTAKINCITTSGALNTSTYLYPPGGGNPVISTSADSWTYAILASGRYSLLVQHSDLTQTGTYQLGLSGPLSTTDVPAGPATSARLELSTARPNPSSGASTFALSLPRKSLVRMSIYDLHGALVCTIADRGLDPGTHRLVWDGCDQRGRRVASGVYLARVRVDGESLTRRIVRLE